MARDPRLFQLFLSGQIADATFELAIAAVELAEVGVDAISRLSTQSKRRFIFTQRAIVATIQQNAGEDCDEHGGELYLFMHDQRTFRYQK